MAGRFRALVTLEGTLGVLAPGFQIADELLALLPPGSLAYCRG